jgi:ABC-type transporter Mla MlaB component
MITHKLQRALLTNSITEQLPLLKRLIFVNKSLTLDLSNVNNVDSAGIAFLVLLKNIAKKSACNLVFTNPSAQINNLCQLYKISL